jgi:NAD(P)H-dependent flavin oxidoreductase YrpB (nitropropane dioxygenase family)
MNKLVVVASIAIAALSITTASATYLKSNSRQAELERATRMENLSVVAVKNGDYELACQAQTQVVDALKKVRPTGQDLIGSAVAQAKDLCQQAQTSAMNQYRYLG